MQPFSFFFRCGGGGGFRVGFKVQGSLLFVTYTIIQGIISSEMFSQDRSAQWKVQKNKKL